MAETQFGTVWDAGGAVGARYALPRPSTGRGAGTLAGAILEKKEETVEDALYFFKNRWPGIHPTNWMPVRDLQGFNRLLWLSL